MLHLLQVLLVAPDEPARRLASHLSKEASCVCVEACGLSAALLQSRWDAVVVYDIGHLHTALLHRLRSQGNEAPLVVVAAAAEVDEAVAAIQAGASDYIPDGRLARLPAAVRRAAAGRACGDYARRERDLLLPIITRIRQSLDLQTIFATAVEEVRAFLGADRTIVYQFDERYRGKVVAESVGAGWTPALDLEIVDTCFEQTRGSQYTRDRILTTSDIYAAGLSACHLQLLERFQVRANLVVPIFVHTRVWGLLIAHQCTGPRLWDDTDIRLLSQIALHLTTAIQQAESVLLERARQAEQKAREERDRLLALIACIRRPHAMQETLETTVREVRQLLDVDRVVVYRFEADWSGQFVAEAVAPGWQPLLGQIECDEVLQQNIAACCAGMCQSAVEDSLSFDRATFRIVEDIYRAGYSECYVRSLERYQARAYIIVPLVQNQTLWGLLAVYQNRGPRHWEESEINLVYQVAAQLTIALQQALLYQASQAQIRELERLAQLKDDFLSTVSHELRTPISNMKVAIHILQRFAQDAKSRAYYDILERECDREIALINNLLDLQRLDSQARPLTSEVITLDQWLPRVVAPFRERTNQCGQVLIVTLAANLPPLITEVTSFEQILVELLNNACKYTPSGERIELALQQMEKYLQLCVSNTGVEIPPDELPRIFDKFYRVPTSDPWRQGGTGLGLALVKRLVQRLGGEIQAESAAGRTSFAVRLPT